MWTREILWDWLSHKVEGVWIPEQARAAELPCRQAAWTTYLQTIE